MIKKLSLYIGLLATTILFVPFAAGQEEEKLTCEKLFNTEECSTCQKTLVELGAASPFTGVEVPKCPTSINFGKALIEAYTAAGYNITEAFTFATFDTAPLKTGLDTYCGQEYSCEQTEIDPVLERIKTDCGEPLSTALDATADPRTLDLTTLITHSLFLAYYGGIPAHEAVCLKNEEDGFCTLDFINKYVEFIKKASNGDTNVTVTLDGKNVILPDGSKVPIPKGLNCGDCWKKTGTIYFTYIDAHRLDEQLENSLFGGYENLKKEFESACEGDADTEAPDVAESEADMLAARRFEASGNRGTRKFKRNGASIIHPFVRFV